MTAELTLRDYLQILRRHRWIALGVVALSLVLALGYSFLATPRYESTSSVLLRTGRNQQLFPAVSDSQSFSFLRDPLAEFEYVESGEFRAGAQAATDGEASVSASYDDSATSTLNRSALLTFRARSSNPAAARNAAQIWAEFYLAERAGDEVAKVETRLATLEIQRDELEQERRRVVEPLAPIEEALLAATDPTIITQLTTQRLTLLQSLESDLLPIEFQLRTLADDLASARIAMSFVETPDVSARLSQSATNARQVSPNVPRNLALGGVLGVLLGVGAALLLDSLRTALTNREDVELITDVPVLAEIPLVDETDAAGTATATRYGAEIERVVSAVVQQTNHFDGTYRVLVTSPGASDGKSTIATELGRRLAMGRLNTVLVDADLRRPVLHRKLGVSHRRSGLAELLGRTDEGSVKLVQTSAEERLRFLPAGSPTDDAASLLRSGIAPVIESIARSRDVVVVDSPPVLLVTDAEVIAESVDGVVVVVRAGRTKRSDLSLTLRRLQATRAELIGIVMVGVQTDDGGGYGYGYDYRANPADQNDAGGDGAKRRRLRSVSA